LKKHGHLICESGDVDSKDVEMTKKEKNKMSVEQVCTEETVLLKSLSGSVHDMVALMKIVVLLLFAILVVLVVVLIRM
jgi:hypothetical protein